MCSRKQVAQVATSNNAISSASQIGVNSYIAVAFLLLQISGTGPACSADEPKATPRVPLPAAWREDHNAMAIYESTGLYAWFLNEDLPFSFCNEVNENPSLPTGILFRGRLGYTTKLNLGDLSHYPGVRALMIPQGHTLERTAFAHIAECPPLRALLIPQSPLDDESLKDLCTSLKRLVVLDVSMSDITDDSVSTLIELKELKQLNVSGTRISLRGVEVLRGSKPKCAVWTERWILSQGQTGHWHEESLEKWKANGKKIP